MFCGNYGRLSSLASLCLPVSCARCIGSPFLATPPTSWPQPAARGRWQPPGWQQAAAAARRRSPATPLPPKLPPCYSAWRLSGALRHCGLHQAAGSCLLCSCSCPPPERALRARPARVPAPGLPAHPACVLGWRAAPPQARLLLRMPASHWRLPAASPRPQRAGCASFGKRQGALDSSQRLPTHLCMSATAMAGPRTCCLIRSNLGAGPPLPGRLAWDSSSSLAAQALAGWRVGTPAGP